MKRFGLVSVLFLLIGFIVFRDISFLYFHSDDFVWLLRAKSDTFFNLPSYFIDTQGFFYRPFTIIYFWQMWQYFRDDSFWYHLMNLLIHFFNSILVFALIQKIVAKNDYFKKRKSEIVSVSFVASLLFFVNPIHLENIIWISAVTELLPALFLLSGLLASIYFFDDQKKRGKLLIVYMGFILGLLSHEYSVVFPLVVFATDMYFSQNNPIKIFIKWKWFYLSLILIDLIYLIIRAYAGSHWSGGDYSYDLVKLPFNFIGNSIGYIGSGIFGISFIPLYQQARVLLRSNLLVAGVLVAFTSMLILICYLQLRKAVNFKRIKVFGSIILYLVSLFIIFLLPFLGLGGIAERYLYLPSFALLLIFSLIIYCFSGFLSKYSESVPVTPIFILISLCIFSLYTLSIINDTKDWKLASDYVGDSMIEFKDNCSKFKEGELLSRRSPPNRIGRAWVYQVGYEEGANLYCPKNLKIHRY